MFTTPTVSITLALSLAVGLSTCGKSGEPAAATPAPKAPAIPVVAVTKPARQSLTRETVLTAEFRPYQQIELHPKVAGYVKEILVDVGSRVKTGDLIAVLDTPDLQAELAEASAARSRAVSEVARAKAEIERYQAAVTLTRASYQRLAQVSKVEAGLIAQQELDEALARTRAAEAEDNSGHAAYDAAVQAAEAAKAAERRLQVLMEYTRVAAPFTGVVTKRYADLGAMIQSGASSPQALPLVRLAEIHRLRLAVMVPESVAGALRAGQTAKIRVPALNLVTTGRIDRFTSNLSIASRTTEIEIDVANPAGRILPGMVAEVDFTLDSRPESLTIPVQSFSNLGGNRYVLVVNQAGVLEERQIQTGFEGTASVEVLSGLGPTDDIVVGNRALLQPGMKVQAKPQGD